jgi:hypothetical protein
MIDTCLTTVIAELNTHLRAQLSLTTDPVLISDIPATEPASSDPGGILATLINIQEDKLASQKQYQSNKPKAVYLELYILFSAAFDSTRSVDALKYISSLISFFGKKPHFEAENTPGLAAGIELDFEIHNLTFQDQSDMWSLLDVKNRPSVLYKVYGVHILTEEV